MFPDDPRAPNLLRVLWWLSRSFRVGRFFGVEVRMYWAAAVLMPLIELAWIWPIAGTTLETLVLVTIATVAVFTIVWTHEMGHIAMARRFGIETRLITLSPLGGVAHLGAPVENAREETWVSLAGPAVHLLWLLPLWPLTHWLPSGTWLPTGWHTDPLYFTVQLLWQANLGLMLFNLLPFFPLDGGRVLRAQLARRMHPNRATMLATAVGLVGAAGLMVWGAWTGGTYGAITVWIGLANLQSCLHERTAARHTLVYGQRGERRAPWQSDPDAWRHGGDPFAHVPVGRAERSPGTIAQWRRRRAEARAARDREADAALDAAVDRVLERVKAVGMAGLTPAEKAILQQAAKRRRGAG